MKIRNMIFISCLAILSLTACPCQIPSEDYSKYYPDLTSYIKFNVVNVSSYGVLGVLIDGYRIPAWNNDTYLISVNGPIRMPYKSPISFYTDSSCTELIKKFNKGNDILELIEDHRDANSYGYITYRLTITDEMLE